MPIKPENRAKYPPDWPEISRRIRDERAKNRCECAGECGRADRHTMRCEAINGNKSPYSGSIVVLTTAHLSPPIENCSDENLRAMCQMFHLAYDREEHTRNSFATRRFRKADGDLFIAAAGPEGGAG